MDFCLENVNRALTLAMSTIRNSDQGSHFTSRAFTDILLKGGIQISMDGRGRCMDNIFTERLWRTVKYEDVYIKSYATIDDAREGLNAYFPFYNKKRPHQSLNYQTRRNCIEEDNERKTTGDPVSNTSLKTVLTTQTTLDSEALNGTDGLASALQKHPDLILLDLLMPGMTGFQLLEKLRKDSWGKIAKVVVISNLKKEDNDLAVAEHLVFDYMNKSDHTLEEVCGRIQLLLKK